MGKNGEKWGKMGKEFYGETILGLENFPIIPHFSQFFSKFRKTLIFLEMAYIIHSMVFNCIICTFSIKPHFKID